MVIKSFIKSNSCTTDITSRTFVEIFVRFIINYIYTSLIPRAGTRRPSSS
nr:MAG TPA: hypothetical protein [Bacteriophage sp.]